MEPVWACLPRLAAKPPASPAPQDYLAWLRLQSDAVLRAQHAMVEAILCCVDGRDQCRASLEAALAKSMWMVML